MKLAGKIIINWFFRNGKQSAKIYLKNNVGIVTRVSRGNAKTDYGFGRAVVYTGGRSTTINPPNDYSIIGFLVFVFSRRRATRDPENL